MGRRGCGEGMMSLFNAYLGTGESCRETVSRGRNRTFAQPRLRARFYRYKVSQRRVSLRALACVAARPAVTFIQSDLFYQLSAASPSARR